jgi:retinol dehydrogenase-12
MGSRPPQPVTDEAPPRMLHSMRGKVIVITGASDGIGRVAAHRLSEAGADVVMIGRNHAKTHAAANAIMSATGLRNVTFEIADLSLQREVHDLAGRLRKRLTKIDVLIDNAGAIFAERRTTAEGLERTFALNHLAYFTLTLLLLPLLSAAATSDHPARVIVVSSRAHVGARLDLGDLQSERSFRAWRAYANTKLENLLFMRELARRLDAAHVTVQALHPGVVATQFAATGNGRWGRFMRWLMNIRSISPAEGADTMIWLATNEDAVRTTGRYWMRRMETSPSRAAKDDAAALALWRASAAIADVDADALIAGSAAGR